MRIQHHTGLLYDDIFVYKIIQSFPDIYVINYYDIYEKPEDSFHVNHCSFSNDNSYIFD